MIASEILNATQILSNPVEPTNFSANGTTFSVDFDRVSFFGSGLGRTISDRCSFAYVPPGNASLYMPANASADSLPNYCLGSAGLAFLAKFQNATDLVSAADSVMGNLATSLTNSIRLGAGGDAQINLFQGIAFLPVTYVETDYIWFTLPIGLILLTLLFLVATITKSQRLGAKNWKSSNFTTLQGLHPNVQNQMGGLEALSIMEGKADKVQVKLLDAKADERSNGVG